MFSKKKFLFRNCFKKATKLSKEGSLSHKSFEMAYVAVQEVLAKCTIANQSLNSQEEVLQRDIHDYNDENMQNNMCAMPVLDPQIPKTK